VGEDYPLRARLAFSNPDLEAACPIANPTSESVPHLTPPWLTPPLRESGISPSKENAQLFQVYTEATEILIADTALTDRPLSNGEGLLQIDKQIVRRAVTAIEIFADLLSVGTRSKRILTSPRPPVGLLAENDEEKSWLSESKGIADLDGMRAVAKKQYDFDLTHFPLDALAD
jgi:hypothetical protein